jgi:hypothetical protein
MKERPEMTRFFNASHRKIRTIRSSLRRGPTVQAHPRFSPQPHLPPPQTIPPDNPFLDLRAIPIPPRIRRRSISGHPAFICPTEYSFALSFRPNRPVSLGSFSVIWPVSVKFPEPILRQITKLLQKFLTNFQIALVEIDELLHFLFSLGSSLNTVKLIYENDPHFNVSMRSSPGSLSLDASDFPSDPRPFSLRFSAGRLQILSSGLFHAFPNPHYISPLTHSDCTMFRGFCSSRASCS